MFKVVVNTYLKVKRIVETTIKVHLTPEMFSFQKIFLFEVILRSFF